MTRVTGQYFVGLDLGQCQDFTAIAVLERAELSGEWDPVMYAAEDDRTAAAAPGAGATGDAVSGSGGAGGGGDALGGAGGAMPPDRGRDSGRRKGSPSSTRSETRKVATSNTTR